MILVAEVVGKKAAESTPVDETEDENEFRKMKNKFLSELQAEQKEKDRQKLRQESRLRAIAAAKLEFEQQRKDIEKKSSGKEETITSRKEPKTSAMLPQKTPPGGVDPLVLKEMVIEVFKDREVVKELREAIIAPEVRPSVVSTATSIDSELASSLYPELHAGSGDGADNLLLQPFKPFLFSTPVHAQTKIREAERFLQQIENVENAINIGRYLKDCNLCIVPGTTNFEFFTAMLPMTKNMLAKFPPGFKAAELRSQISSFSGKMSTAFVMVSFVWFGLPFCTN